MICRYIVYVHKCLCTCMAMVTNCEALHGYICHFKEQMATYSYITNKVKSNEVIIFYVCKAD